MLIAKLGTESNLVLKVKRKSAWREYMMALKNKIAVLVVFLVLIPLNAFAANFDFWTKFPDYQFQNGLEIMTVNPFDTNIPRQLIHVSPSGSYAFTNDGTPEAPPLVQRSTQPWILLQSSGYNQALMVFVPTRPMLIDLSGEFKSINGGLVYVNFGVTGQGSIWDNQLNSGATAPFSASRLKISPTNVLFFAVDGDGRTDTATLLKVTMQIHSNTLPGNLLLIE